MAEKSKIEEFEELIELKKRLGNCDEWWETTEPPKCVQMFRTSSMYSEPKAVAREIDEIQQLLDEVHGRQGGTLGAGTVVLGNAIRHVVLVHLDSKIKEAARLARSESVQLRESAEASLKRAALVNEHLQ